MPTLHHGKDAYFALADSGATLRQFPIESISGLPGARELDTFAVIGDEGMRSIPGLENATFSLSGPFDSATNGQHAVMASLRTTSTAAAWEYGPAGNGTGMPKLSGTCWISGYNVDVEATSKVPYSAEFQVEGVVTLGVF